MPEDLKSADEETSLRRALRWAAVLNVAYFGVEFTVARRIGSVSLFADSIDFLEDASIHSLILLALRWPRPRRGTAGILLAVLVPGLATLWIAWQKFTLPVLPSPVWLTLTGLGALAIISGAPSCWRAFDTWAGISRARPSYPRATLCSRTSPLSRPAD